MAVGPDIARETHDDCAFENAAELILSGFPTPKAFALVIGDEISEQPNKLFVAGSDMSVFSVPTKIAGRFWLCGVRSDLSTLVLAGGAALDRKSNGKNFVRGYWERRNGINYQRSAAEMVTYSLAEVTGSFHYDPEVTSGKFTWMKSREIGRVGGFEVPLAYRFRFETTGNSIFYGLGNQQEISATLKFAGGLLDSEKLRVPGQDQKKISGGKTLQVERIKSAVNIVRTLDPDMGVLGEFTRHEWLDFIDALTKRHLDQIRYTNNLINPHYVFS